MVILKVAVGLGFVIFVHELGHFVVAKLCGVKCEKFYLGFDIAGLKFCKFRWGETEYGIGILPLGGYVKMLGQEDNPGQAARGDGAGQAEAGEGERKAAGADGGGQRQRSVPVATSATIRFRSTQVPNSADPSPLRSPQLPGQERAASGWRSSRPA